MFLDGVPQVWFGGGHACCCYACTPCTQGTSMGVTVNFAILGWLCSFLSLFFLSVIFVSSCVLVFCSPSPACCASSTFFTSYVYERMVQDGIRNGLLLTAAAGQDRRTCLVACLPYFLAETGQGQGQEDRVVTWPGNLPTYKQHNAIHLLCDVQACSLEEQTSLPCLLNLLLPALPSPFLSIP